MHAHTPTPVRRLFVVGSYIQASCWHVAHLPQPDDSQLARDYCQEPGGKGLAVALGAHRLGSAVDLLLAIGGDAAGDGLLARMRAEGMDTALVRRYPGHSGQGAGLIDARGNTVVTVHPGANQRLDHAALDQARASLAAAHVVYGQLEAPLATVTQALVHARAQGATTVLNPSPWQAMPGALLDATDILVVNRREAGALLQCEPRWDAGEGLARALAPHIARLRARWPGQRLVITLGADGCLAFDADDRALRLPGHPVADPHAIGAGDAFSAGLCHALLRADAWPDALAMANACGALAAARPGILDGLPRADEAHALLSRAA